MMWDILERIRVEDPVSENEHVFKSDNETICCWKLEVQSLEFRKADDCNHINVVELEAAIDRWEVHLFFRTAYRPSGNEIVKSHHRKIKSMEERGNVSQLVTVFWYNMSPRSGEVDESVPQRVVFKYEWWLPSKLSRCFMEVRDEVYVKPPNARCAAQWKRAIVMVVN